MQTGPETQFTSNISQSEKKMLSEVLKHYEFYADTVDKVRSAYMVHTDRGVFCLKRVSHGYRKGKRL